MEKMISLSAEERNNMGKKAREKIIREYDKEIVLSAYLKEIEQIITSEERVHALSFT